MNSVVRSMATVALAAFTITGSAVPTSASSIRYEITNDIPDQNGFLLSGLITLDRTGTFTNDASAITGWSILVYDSFNELGWYFNSPNGFGSFPTVFGTLTATSDGLFLESTSQLAFYSSSVVSDGGLFWVNTLPGNQGPFSSYTAKTSFRTFWDSNTFSPNVDGVWKIGTAEFGPQPIPEIDPATAGSALSLVAGVLAMIEQRRRRATLAT